MRTSTLSNPPGRHFAHTRGGARALLFLLVAAAITPLQPAAADVWPTPPEKHVQTIRKLPDHDHLALLVPDGATAGASRQIEVFDLTTGSEFKWAILNQTMREAPPSHFGSIAAWARWAGKLFYASSRSASFLDRTGGTEDLHLQMPPNMWSPMDGMSSYAISPDGREIAYFLYTRDKNDKLYTDLMIQDTRGSTPVSIWNDGAMVLAPAWRPDARAVAHADKNGDLVVSDLQGRVLWSTHPADALTPSQTQLGLNRIVPQLILHIEWDPTGKQVAFLKRVPDPKLYVVNSDGTGLRLLAFRNEFGLATHPAIGTFAWSPDGRQLLISAASTSICNYSALVYKFETGRFPCIYGQDLYLSDSDGGHFRKVTSAPIFEPGDLLWIQ